MRRPGHRLHSHSMLKSQVCLSHPTRDAPECCKIPSSLYDVLPGKWAIARLRGYDIGCFTYNRAITMLQLLFKICSVNHVQESLELLCYV